MAANKATLERVMQVTMKNKKAGTEIATAILGIEAMILSGITVTAVVENMDRKTVSRCRATLCHKAFGKRLADAISTIDSIIKTEAIIVVAMDKMISPSTNKQMLKKLCSDEFARKDVGGAVSDIVSKAELAIEALLVKYTANAPVKAKLLAIKAILNS